MKARFVSESMNFEREGTPYEKLKIGSGRWKPYPKMSVEEFQQWFESEIKPYYESELGFDMVLDNLINNDLESDEELAAYWKGEIPDEAIKKLIPMRDYFMDFRYSSKFGY